MGGRLLLSGLVEKVAGGRIAGGPGVTSGGAEVGMAVVTATRTATPGRAGQGHSLTHADQPNSEQRAARSRSMSRRLLVSFVCRLWVLGFGAGWV